MTADQIKALIKSHAEGDEDRFYAVVVQVAADEARQGHGTLAKELRTLIDRVRDASALALVAQPRGELAGLLSVAYPKIRLGDLILAADIGIRVERVLHEQRSREKLRTHGLPPRRKLLLVGPPGTGKTMTAAALAGELHLPLFTIVLDGLITKFMGETAAKLRLVFDAISRTRGVYLFDEFDAIGGHRALSNDVGEIRRVLNSFLLFVEQDVSDSLIVAATNHPQMLDSALFRRFDDVIGYSLPDRSLLERSFRERLVSLDTSGLDWEKVVEASTGFSYADVTRCCEDVAKSAVLRDSQTVTTEEIISSIAERKSFRR